MEQLRSSWLLLTNQCNLRCKYCWLTNFGENVAPSKMDIETARQSVEFMKKYGEEGADITFFGGEPLLEFDTIRILMDENRTLNYGIYTNSVLLNEEHIEFFHKRRDFIKITLSIDGTPEASMEGRGAGYDEKIVSEVFTRFPTSSARFTVYNPDNIYDGVKYLYDLGAKKIVVNVPHFMDLSSEYFSKFREGMARVKNNYFLSSVAKVWEDGARKFCKAGIEYVAIAPDGNLYPCDLFYWLGKNNIGNVRDGINPDLINSLTNTLSKENTIYTSCVAEQLYCRETAIRNDLNFKQ